VSRGFPTRARFAAEWLLVRALSRAVGLVSMAAARAWGANVGRLVHAVDAFHRDIARDNLARAFPSRSDADVRALTRETFAHFGSLLFELLKVGQISQADLLRLSEFEGSERVAHAYAQGRGVLFFTGHFGYWEMQALAQPLVAYAVSVLARPLDNPRLHELLERIRTSTGNAVIYRQGAVRRVLRDLSENRGVAILIDQHLHSPDVVYVDYFGRRAATTTALASLALRTGAPVIPVFALPLPGGRYRFVYEHPVDPPDAASPDAVAVFTQRCTDVLEMYVRREPELWLWMHRRWREPSAESPRAAATLDEGALDA
jgi:KDO2-lipid IV(A) lauroyltransferase